MSFSPVMRKMFPFDDVIMASSAVTGIYREKWAKTMTADSLAPRVPRPSGATVLRKQFNICEILRTHHSVPLQWRHNECYGDSNHRRIDCLLSRLFRRRSKKTSKLRVTGLCAGNSPVIGEFPAQMASDVENVSIWWSYYDSHAPVWDLSVSSGGICNRFYSPAVRTDPYLENTTAKYYIEHN